MMTAISEEALSHVTGPDGNLLNVWVTSDHHFGHANISQYADRPEDHEQRMISAWRRLVSDEDVVLHLGDIALGPREHFERIRPQLPGRLLIRRGNHDRSVAYLRSLGFLVVPSFSAPYDGVQVRFSHKPDDQWVAHQHGCAVNIHGHIHQHRRADLRFINVSVEQTDYAPVRLHRLLDRYFSDLPSDIDPR